MTAAAKQTTAVLALAALTLSLFVAPAQAYEDDSVVVTNSNTALIANVSIATSNTGEEVPLIKKLKSLAETVVVPTISFSTVIVPWGAAWPLTSASGARIIAHNAHSANAICTFPTAKNEEFILSYVYYYV